jgi:hypothetical protein
MSTFLKSKPNKNSILFRTLKALTTLNNLDTLSRYAKINLTFSFTGSASIQGITNYPNYLSGCRLTAAYSRGSSLHRHVVFI